MTQLLVSDLHMGQGSALGRLADQQRSWVSVCTTAADMEWDVLIGGDVFHARRPSALEMAAFQSGLDILAEGDCSLIGIAGNHDIVDRDQPTAFEVACAGYDAHVCRTAEVHRTEDGPIGFLPWGIGSGNASETSEALIIAAEDLAERGARILIAHFGIAGGSLPNGLPVLDLAEPLLDPYRLASMFDLVLSGHIHKRQEIVALPPIGHIGVLSIGNFGERDLRPGAWQITGADNLLSSSWFEVADRRFVQIDLDVRGESNPTAAIIDYFDMDELNSAIVRVSFRQTSDQVIDTVALLAALESAGAHRIDTLTPIIERAKSIRSAGVTEATDPRESWDRWADGQEIPDGIAETVRESAHERIGGAA